MLSTEYLLDVDIKKSSTVFTPIFRRGDTAILKFRVHDDDINSPIKKFDKAEITIVMPSGINLREACQKENIQGVDIARFQFQKIHSIEIGLYQIYLTLFTGTDRVSVPPITIELIDNVSEDDYEFEELIRDLQRELDLIKQQVNNGIPIGSINMPDGIAGLDKNKKLLTSVLPDYFDLHMITSMYKDGAHGFRIEPDGKPYVLINGNWEEVTFSEYPMGGGSTPTPPTIDIDGGNVTVTFPETSDVVLKKWDKGIQEVEWFRINGTVFTGSSFTATTAGSYTIYYQLANGKEYVYIFEVRPEDLMPDTKTPIKDIENGSVVKFGGREWILLDNKTGYLISLLDIGEQVFSPDNKKFDPVSVNNIGYWLNNNFLSTLEYRDRQSILEHTWNTGGEDAESQTTVKANVGMISMSEANKYKDSLNKYPNIDDRLMAFKGFYTITEDSSDNTQAWALSLQNNMWSPYALRKNISLKVRAAIYLPINLKLDKVEQSEVVPLSQFNDGDTVLFSGMRWTILDKTKNLLIYNDDNIVRDYNKMETWLNGDFYYTLTSQARSFIQNTEYNVQEHSSSGIAEKKTTVRITIPSAEMWNQYKDTTMSHIKNTQLIHTSVVSKETATSHLVLNPEVYPVASLPELTLMDAQAFANVLPIVTLSNAATVGAISKDQFTVANMEVGQQFTFGGYSWLHAGDGYAVLKGRFKYDTFNWKIPFTGDVSDQGYIINDTTDSIAKQANNSFLLNYVNKKDESKLATMSLNIGLVNQENTRIGNYKIGLIPNNIWNSNYSIELYKKVEMSEDAWVLNWLNETTAQCIDALTGRLKNANPITDKKLFKPMIKLDGSITVENYKPDSSMYAHIPDPIVRKCINQNLGYGYVDQPVLVEDTKKITSFDTISLFEATDLTGMELLVNCTFLRLTTPNDKFVTTNFNPLIEMSNHKLKEIFIYGVTKNSTVHTNLNQLKGKFPLIIRGGVYTNAFEEILITTAELKGIANGIYIRPQDELFLYAEEDGVHVGYSYVAILYGWGKMITHVKGFLDDDYVELNAPTSDYSTNTRSEFRLPSLFEGTESKLYEAWFKDADGNELKVFVQFTDSFGISWNSRDMKPFTAITREKASQQVDLVLPNEINGIPMHSLGYRNNATLMYQSTIKSVTIPANYKEVWNVFSDCYSLENVYFANQQIVFHDKQKAFSKPTYSSSGINTSVTFHGALNSTVYDLYQFKISDENTDSQQTKTLYKFKETK